MTLVGPAKAIAGSAEQRFRGGFAPVEQASDLADRELVEVAQRERETLILGKPGQRRLDGVAFVTRLPDAGIGRALVNKAKVAVRTAAIAAHMVDQQVATDCADAGHQIGIAEELHARANPLDEGFLRDVVVKRLIGTPGHEVAVYAR